MSRIMKRLLLKISIIFLICVISKGMNLYAETIVSVEEPENSEEYQIGVMVKSIQKALEDPEAAGSIMTITRYGLDSRYYKMIRGWLLLELSGVESQYEAAKEDSIRQKHALKIEFLKKAIRAIDQE